MKIAIYKWDGTYWGFIYNRRLYDLNSNYKGWLDKNDDAWNVDGTYLGELVKENYILRRINRMAPMSRIPKIPPIPPIPPIPKISRLPKLPVVGWMDVLK